MTTDACRVEHVQDVIGLVVMNAMNAILNIKRACGSARQAKQGGYHTCDMTVGVCSSLTVAGK